MKMLRFLAACMFASAATLLAVPASATLQVTRIADAGGPSAHDLAAGLVAGSGITLVAGSASYVGDPVASGWFSGGGTDLASGIGFDQGVILTTGDAANATHDNFDGLCCVDANHSPGNALLDPLTNGEGSNNASILSFSFVPTTSAITLRYVFASEEYNEFVGPYFNGDVLGVFVNGVNFALVPGTPTPVGINGINCVGVGVNCSLYRDNAPFTGGIGIQYDGLTTVLTLTAPVQAGQVNTIRLGIADSFDTAYDSALFVQMGSLAPVPEPASGALFALGGLVLWCGRRRLADRSGLTGLSAP